MAIPSGHNFAACYIDLCKQKRLRPLPIICMTLPHSLNFTTDRVKMNDWGPILNSLSLDRSLKSVSVRGRYQCRKSFDNINLISKTRKFGKPPVVLNRYLLEWLSHSVAQCVTNSPALTCLELEGVPLPADCLAALCVGLSGTKTLQHLSLKRCYIGDKCCAMVCKTIADIHSIKSLNLSQCNLSSNSGAALASALTKQKLLLYHDTWKDSLRYREPNFEAMGGLRRLTLNGNPHLGNLAAAQIIHAIQDSFWLKAFDLQNCGLTDAIGDEIIELLNHNKTLEVIDVRLNSNVNENIVQDIFKQLETNNIGCKLQYRLLTLTQKDSKIVSEGGNKHRNNCNNVNRVTQMNSAINNKSKNFGQLSSLQSINSIPIVGKKMKTCLSLPSSIPIQKLNDKMPITEGQSSSLHLDLQSRIRSMNDDSSRMDQMDKLENSPTINDLCQTDCNTEAAAITTKEILKMEDILRELSDAKNEREKLLKSTQSMEQELREERVRRKDNEIKIWKMQRNLMELKGALKAKELESCRCLMVNEESIDNISMTLEQLITVMDDLSKKPSARCHADEERARDDIRQRITRLIRETKSEKLHRELNDAQLTTKFSKSESDIIKLSSINTPIHLEKNIGDHPDAISITTSMNNNFTRHEKLKPMFSPCERARAIFAQVINGDVILNLNSHVS